MSFIDGSRLSEFLDDHKKSKLDRKALRTDVELLKRAGVSFLENMPTHRRRTRILEYFLLRSQLYTPEGPELVPYRIDDFWSDYAKAWRIKINGKEIHLPFFGKIGFICKINSKERMICHPESSSLVDRILIDTGALSLQTDPDGTEQRYIKKTCKALLDAFKRKETLELQQIGDKPFGRALLSIGLANKTGQAYSFGGNGLLIDEMKKIKTVGDYEKVARLILRNEQNKQAQVASVISCLEFLERNKHPAELPIGSAPSHWESKKTKKRYDRLGHYDLVADRCSLDTRAAANILGKADPYEAYASFGAFMDIYYKTEIRNGEEWSDTFAFLSWYTDSLAYLGLSEAELEETYWPKFKRQKTKRHIAFLRRFINKPIFQFSNPENAKKQFAKLTNSEIIDMNLDPTKFFSTHIENVDYCTSNIYVASNVPVDRELFESTVLEVLQSESKFKDSQGAFYYPDFRFLIASTLGLNLRSADQILAYVISTGSDLGRRLWFYPAFGNVPRRDRPDQQLMDVISKPFDTITLNY